MGSASGLAVVLKWHCREAWQHLMMARPAAVTQRHIAGCKHPAHSPRCRIRWRLCDSRYVAAGLTYQQQDALRLQRHVETAEDTEALRDSLTAKGLVAFVGNGATLPRCPAAAR